MRDLDESRFMAFKVQLWQTCWTLGPSLWKVIATVILGRTIGICIISLLPRENPGFLPTVQRRSCHLVDTTRNDKSRAKRPPNLRDAYLTLLDVSELQMRAQVRLLMSDLVFPIWLYLLHFTSLTLVSHTIIDVNTPRKNLSYKTGCIFAQVEGRTDLAWNCS